MIRIGKMKEFDRFFELVEKIDQKIKEINKNYKKEMQITENEIKKLEAK